MKTLAIGLAVLSCLGLSACAGTSGRTGIVRDSTIGELDYGKIVAVNEWALQRGATVKWVNYPVVQGDPQANGG